MSCEQALGCVTHSHSMSTSFALLTYAATTPPFPRMHSRRYSLHRCVAVDFASHLIGSQCIAGINWAKYTIRFTVLARTPPMALSPLRPAIPATKDDVFKNQYICVAEIEVLDVAADRALPPCMPFAFQAPTPASTSHTYHWHGIRALHFMYRCTLHLSCLLLQLPLCCCLHSHLLVSQAAGISCGG